MQRHKIDWFDMLLLALLFSILGYIAGYGSALHRVEMYETELTQCQDELQNLRALEIQLEDMRKGE
jgi:Tfp pilus assembly protein PilO